MQEKWPVRKIVLVEWRDSSSRGQWDTPEKYREGTHLGPIRSVGYVLESNKDRLVLVQSQSAATGHVADSISIPREAITKTRIL